MIRGIHTALAGMRAGLARTEMVSDEIANVSTTGYKRTRAADEAFGLEVARSGGPAIGPLGTGATLAAGELVFEQGAVVQTDRPTDLAIDGDGLFVVRTPTGVAYTRAGDLSLDAARTLVTPQGHVVLDTAGRPIVAPDAFSVGPDGTVAGTEQRIALVTWPEAGVQRLGGNLLAAPGTLPPAAGRIRQGALEQSTVDLATATTDLIRSQRQFALSARMFAIQEGTLDDAIGLGRLR